MSFSIFIPDTSVIIKWFKEKDEEYVSEAKLLKEQYFSGKISIILLDLCIYEFGNILRLKSKLPKEIAAKKLIDFWFLDLPVVYIDQEMSHKAMNIAYDYNLTFYDASFIAFAQSLGCNFITADKKLYEKIKDVSNIVFLGNFFT
ncbi:MAG: type II toxin-antitoxin system VapC family toxin [Candidatus Aminicenantia bacterium]